MENGNCDSRDLICMPKLQYYTIQVFKYIRKSKLNKYENWTAHGTTGSLQIIWKYLHSTCWQRYILQRASYESQKKAGKTRFWIQSFVWFGWYIVACSYIHQPYEHIVDFFVAIKKKRNQTWKSIENINQSDSGLSFYELTSISTMKIFCRCRNIGGWKKRRC